MYLAGKTKTLPTKRYWVLIALAFIAIIQYPVSTIAQGKSGLAVPRFVSLKSNQVNMRVGPGRNYQVEWLYVRKGLPMEVIQEFDNWRKVRDPQGNEGWVIHSLLAGDRVAIIAPWEIPQNQEADAKENAPTVNMYVAADGTTDVIARVEAGALAKIHSCSNNWCRLTAMQQNSAEISGFISQSQLWGIYPDEVLAQ